MITMKLPLRLCGLVIAGILPLLAAPAMAQSTPEARLAAFRERVTRLRTL